MFTFRFQGGADRPSMHTVEKFLLFVLVSGKEVALYQAKQLGIVGIGNEPFEYETNEQHVKLFLSQAGIGPRRFFHSFYLRLSDSAPQITIHTMSKDELGWSFKARCEMLSQKEVLDLLPPTSESRKFVMMQGLLPKATMAKLVEVDDTVKREGIRFVRIGRREVK